MLLRTLCLLLVLFAAPSLQALPLTQYGSENSFIRITNPTANGNCSLPSGNECASAVDDLPVANYSDAGQPAIVGGGSVEAGVLHGSVSSTSGTAAKLNADARDQFTVEGPTAGETISITAHLLTTGTVDIINTGLGVSFGTIFSTLGTDWSSTYGGVDDFLSSVSDGTGYVAGSASIPLSAEAVATFDVTTGTSFQLAYGLQLSTKAAGSGTVEADFLNTSTLSFDLPDGYTITSIGGFGMVPEPTTALLLAAGLVGCLLAGRDR